MSLGTREYLLFMLPALAAGLLLIWWALWRVEARRRFGVRLPSQPLAYIAPAVLLLAACVAAFAAARPQIGEKTTAVERKGIDLVVVLDISQSMLATDTQPTRLARAQAEIAALLDRMQGDRAGLVIFAGEPFVRSPLTSDLAALRELTLGVHQERGLVESGSDLGAALRTGRELLATGTADTKAILVVSDGEDHGGSVDVAIQEAAFAGVRVYTAGAGTAAGSPVLDLDEDTNAVIPRVGSDGEPVLTRLDADALQAMAATGGGRYIELAGETATLADLAGELASLDSTTFEREETSEPIERFQVFAAIALALVLVGTLLAASVTRGFRARAQRLLPVAAAGLLVGGICSTDAAEWNRRGNRQFDAGDYAQALESYGRAQELSPEEKALYYNRANAFAQLGEYVSAIDETQRALPTDDPALEAIVEYALGGHYANADQLREALEAYKRSLYADPGDEDAKHNYEIVANRLTPTNPTPTPSVPAPEPTPPDGGNEGDPGATPEPGEGTPGTGTPQAGGTPGTGEQPLSEEELQRLLQEALAGIDEEFTTEEALRVLEILQEQNRSQLEEPSGGAGQAPDY